jgi:hypothetical protein
VPAHRPASPDPLPRRLVFPAKKAAAEKKKKKLDEKMEKGNQPKII